MGSPRSFAQPSAKIDQILILNPQIKLWVSGHTHTPPTQPTFDNDINYYHGKILDVYNPTWDGKTIWTNSLYLYKDKIVIISAHLDSRAANDHSIAPGAEDNGSGVAALMEAARLFKNVKFDRTIKIIFFTGEEQGLIGSKAYVAAYPADISKTVAVFNLDMFGYDYDQDM